MLLNINSRYKYVFVLRRFWYFKLQFQKGNFTSNININFIPDYLPSTLPVK